MQPSKLEKYGLDKDMTDILYKKYLEIKGSTSNNN